MFGPFVQLTSSPHLGVPLTITVGGTPDGLGTDHYVAVYSKSDARIMYEWITPPNPNVVIPPDRVPIESHTDNVEFHLKYFTGGGYILTGTVVAQQTVTLRNPVVRFSAALVDDATIAVAYTLEATLSNARVTVATADGCRLATAGVAASAGFQSELRMMRPRVPDTYHVRFLCGTGSETTLRECRVSIGPRGRPYSLCFTSGGSSDHYTRAITVIRNTNVRVACSGGDLTSNDCVAVIACSDVSAAPSTLALQTPLATFGLSGDGTATITFRDNGVFYVCLGLRHASGTFLCGTFGLALVTDMAAAATPSCVQTNVAAPLPPVAQPSSSAGDDRIMCVVCRDRIVCIKLAPCCHVCLCEGCEVWRCGVGVAQCAPCAVRR